jgi:hypothetical protein
VHHVSSGSGSCLPDKKVSGTATCIVALDPLGGLRCTTCPAVPDPASLQRGLQDAMRPTVPFGPRASNIKKSLASLSMQSGSYVLNARAHVSKVPNIRVIMGMQDVRADNAFNAYNMCQHVATVRLQCNACPANHTHAIATVSGDAIGPNHATDRVRCGRATGQGLLHALPKPSLVIPSHKALATIICFEPLHCHLSGPEAQCNCPTLSYKRIGQAPILDNVNFAKFNSVLNSVKHTQQYNSHSHGHRVLRSSSPNHIKYRVYLAQAYESLSPSNNEPQRASLVVVWWKCRKTTSTFGTSRRVGGSSWLPSSTSFFFFTLLPYGFTPAYDFMLRRVLNHDGMNKLFELSISVSFTLWVTCLGFVPEYVA